MKCSNFRSSGETFQHLQWLISIRCVLPGITVYNVFIEMFYISYISFRSLDISCFIVCTCEHFLWHWSFQRRGVSWIGSLSTYFYLMIQISNLSWLGSLSTYLCHISNFIFVSDNRTGGFSAISKVYSRTDPILAPIPFFKIPRFMNQSAHCWRTKKN